MAKTKICPRCGSTDISFKSYGYSVEDYCKECGFGEHSASGSIFPEVDVEDVEQIRKEIA